MSLKEQFDTELKEAMRTKDEVRLNVLRQLKTSIRNKEVELQGDCDDASVLKIVAALAKQRRDSIEQFTQGGRKDLADKEQAELALLEAYLPKQLSANALGKLIDAVIAAEGATSAKDMGKVMKAVLSKVAGQADGKVVSDLVKERLQ